MKKRMILNAAKKSEDILRGMNSRPFLNAENEASPENNASNPEENGLNNEAMPEENQNETPISEDETNQVPNPTIGNQPPRQSIRGALRNFGSGALLRNMLSSNNAKEAKKTAEEAGKAYIKKATKKIIVAKLAPILIIFLIIFFVVTLFVGIFTVFEESDSSSVGMGGYYELQCPEMTVIKSDGTVETYSAIDYVAGVVRAEVGGFNNLEVYKAFAVGARTYGETHHDGTCTIAGDATRQAFKDITNDESENAKLIYQAVEETDGIVMLEGGSISSYSEYDAFCYIEKNSSEYILSQKNQAIPINWVENHVGSYYYKNCPCDANDNSKTDCWENGHWKDGGHGRGMSQFGALYLATEEGYTYDKILGYYYDDITLSTHGFMSSIIGLEIKDTKSATVLNESLAEFLPAHGSSVEELNSLIKEKVKEEDKQGTREGVVIAAVTLINYLNDGFGVKLPYYWGGKYPYIGINPNFGGYTSASEHGQVHAGFDCSGFVSWAIINGGFNFGNGEATSGFDRRFKANSCDMIHDSSCVGQPGDLINSYGSGSNHVQLIVHTDVENQKYYIAESSGSLFIQQVEMHGSRLYNPYIIHMDEFYNNSANRNLEY